jgi:molybdopterin molybdotransferase
MACVNAAIGLRIGLLIAGLNEYFQRIMTSPQRLPASLTPLDAALAALLRDVRPTAAHERTAGSGSAALELPELKSWPPHDIAASDGWTLRASDLVGASSYTPLPLAKPPVWLEAGDKIPDGCDCVLDEDSVELTGTIAQMLAEAIPGQGVRRKGGAIADANRLVDAWRSGDFSANRPRVRLVNVSGGDITARFIANGLLEGDADVMCVEASARDAVSIGKELDNSDCDLLIVIGGSGVGRTDASVVALAERGEVIAHGLALQPGRTAAVGRLGRTPVIVIPGASDQALGVWWTLALPVLDRLANRERGTLSFPIARKIASSVGLAEIVLLERRDDAWMPLAIGDLPLETVARADAWLLVPSGCEGYAAGTPADAYLLRE